VGYGHIGTQFGLLAEQLGMSAVFLAHVNEKLSAAGINIAAQYLSTNEDVGYVVIDIDHAATRPALAELCTVPATIRCRILY